MNDRQARVTTLLLERRTKALKRHLPSAVAGDDVGVHQARVATRRLREAVPVLATDLKDGKADKASRKIRRLTRALGTVRELDVTIQLLDQMATEHLPRAAVEDVRARVLADREQRRKVMLTRLERVNADKLERRLASVAEALQECEHEGWREALASRVTKRAGRLAEAIDAAGQLYAPDRLHRVRIAAKKLRYGLELAAESGAAHAAAHVRAIKRVQELLGRLNDLQVLQTHVAAVQAEPPRGRASVHALDALSRYIEDQCRYLHGRYIASVPALRDTCEAVRDTIAPSLVKPPRRRPRPLKMTLPRRPAIAAGGR